MKLRGKKLKIFVLLGCFLVLVANAAYSGEWKAPAKWKFLRFAGGSAAGSWTATGAKICELINQQIPGVNASSTLGATYSNCTAVETGKMQLGWQSSESLPECYYGLGKMKGKATNSLRAIASLHYGVYYQFVPKKSDIKDLSEIAKRPLRTAVGPVGSAFWMVAQRVLRAYGSSIEDLVARGGTAHNVYYGPATGMMKNGQIDYLTFPSSPYASMVMDVATSPGIRFLELGPKQKAQIMKELLGATDTVIPKDMYPGVEKDFHTMARYYIIVVRKDMPEELAYRITRVIWDNLDELQRVGAFGKFMKLETAFNGMITPIHPGAVRYYKEKGMTPPKPKVPDIVRK
jgi:TRAP transporter TAXI family solute receptor